MRVAYGAAEAADARNLLYKLHDELLQSNPSAAASLMEGLEECLTVSELRLAPKIRQTFSSTNCIESGFSIVEHICQQAKRWQGNDHRLRWVGSALLFAESRWNRIHGYRHMPMLIKALNAAYHLRCARYQADLKAQISAA
jgi:transposase-like protein